VGAAAGGVRAPSVDVPVRPVVPAQGDRGQAVRPDLAGLVVDGVLAVLVLHVWVGFPGPFVGDVGDGHPVARVLEVDGVAGAGLVVGVGVQFVPRCVGRSAGPVCGPGRGYERDQTTPQHEQAVGVASAEAGISRLLPPTSPLGRCCHQTSDDGQLRPECRRAP